MPEARVNSTRAFLMGTRVTWEGRPMLVVESNSRIEGQITFDQDGEIQIAPGATNVHVSGVTFAAAKMCPKCKKSGKACKC